MQDLPPIHTESSVKERYAAAAGVQEAALCCPVEYDRKFLEVIPQEVIDKDYGCGDPSQYLHPGETVLDLGSGTGKICFIASQVVGEHGKVIGVDMTDDMLEVAHRNAPIVADRIGFSNVEFRKGRIQDLGLDLDLLHKQLKAQPVDSANAFLEVEAVAEELRVKNPLIPSESIDVVVSNCVLNLVESKLKRQMFEEIFRVLKVGGRAVISDIVSDEEVPLAMQDDPELWSGCISGAMTEEGFLKAFEDAGFYGVSILKFDIKPWQTVNGFEFRSMTIEAFKGKQGTCLERNQAVVYHGPFKQITDDDGHTMQRGVRYAVCDKTYNLFRQPPYCDNFSFLDPLQPIAIEDAKAFTCLQTTRRHPRESKGQDYSTTTDASNCCGPESC